MVELLDYLDHGEISWHIPKNPGHRNVVIRLT